jgi:uncharacterized membrane protein
MLTVKSTGAGRGPRRRRPGRRTATLLAIGGLTSLLLAPAARAAGGLDVTTPYASVAVEPGNKVSFPLKIVSNAERRVGLAVTAVPDGWKATVRGGGFIVDAVTAGPTGAPDVTLDVEVPDAASDGTYRVSIRASGGGDAADTLDLDLRVAAASGGSVTLTTDNPALRDTATATFPFSLNLENGTPRELTFALSTESPGAGWTVTATPAGQTQVASFTVAAGARQSVSVSVKAPDAVAAGVYPIKVTASAGDQTATAELQVEIVGNVAFHLTTPDQRLSANASAGQRKDIQVVVVNDGTAPVTAITLAGTAPTGWTVAFDPESVAQVAPDVPQTVTVQLTPSGSAIAGDYNVTLTASTADGARKSIEMRITVDTSLSWGLIGIALILLVLVGLSWVFQRYGRR